MTRTPSIDGGEIVREPTEGEVDCGIWVGHFDDDPDADVLEVQNFRRDSSVTSLAIPKADVPAVVDALERRR
jgi:hypothetical protein